MNHRPDSHAWLKRGPQLLERLDKLVRAGRLSDEEAARLRTAADTGQLDDAAREIQLRHASARVNEAVADGTITQEQARVLLERLASGEDPRFLRGLRRGRSPNVATGT
ncbi:MAG: hypothetical protein LC799_11865 [Actinobacteria bacterium]|nr:hypothetical protein [Actinomycetota bacterium]